MPAPFSARPSTWSRRPKQDYPCPPPPKPFWKVGSTPTKKTKEGPFGERSGYYSGGQRSNPTPILELRALSCSASILFSSASSPPKPPHDYSFMKSVMKSAMIQDALVRAGLRGVRGVWAPECGGGRSFIVVSMKQAFCGTFQTGGRHRRALSRGVVYESLRRDRR